MGIGGRILIALATTALVLATFACAVGLLSPLLIALAPSDAMKRLPLFAFAGLVVSGLALGLRLRGRSLRTLTGAEVRAVLGALIVAGTAVGWAAWGIDSTRPVRELPEAAIAFPGAVETHRATRPADANLFVHEGATLDRSYETSARYEDVIAFYRNELAARGWSGGAYYGLSSSDLRPYHWRRAGFTFYVDIPTGNLATSGPFRARLIGPPP